MAASKLKAFWDHPAGPKTSISPFTFGLRLLSGSSALRTLLTSPNHLRRSLTLSKQKNWNLFSVNVAMAGTGIYQISRKIKHDYFSETKDIAGKE